MWGLLLLVSFARAEQWRGGPPFEPVVTPRENRVLQEALRVAETNVTAAVVLLETGPDRGAALAFAAGNLLFQDGDYAGAEQAYREAIRILPRFRSALANLGRIHLLQERPADAIALYQQLVADGQADADILLLLGHALLMENHPVSAEGAYRQSLLLRPQAVEALTGLAKSLFAQERFDEALALSREILLHTPENPELWALRVNAYLMSGRYSEAIRSIETARRLGAADSGMLATMGDLLLNENQPGDALRIYIEAWEKGRLSVERMLRAVDGFMMTGDLDRAEEMLSAVDATVAEAERDRAMQVDVLRHRARIAWQRGVRGDARNLAQEALRLDPLDGKILLLLAEIEKAEENWEQAILHAERAARVPGMEAEALVQQALIAVQRQRYDQAIALLEAAQVYREQPHVARYLEQLRRMSP